MFRGFDTHSVLGRVAPLNGTWPSVEFSETDKEIRVTAEIPGLDENEVEVTPDDGVLTLRGEKKAETEDKDRQFSERYYGRLSGAGPRTWRGWPNDVRQPQTKERSWDAELTLRPREVTNDQSGFPCPRAG